MIGQSDILQIQGSNVRTNKTDKTNNVNGFNLNKGAGYINENTLYWNDGM